MTNFQEMVIWITGASSGLGRALALELSARKARLILSSRRADQLEEVRKACPGSEIFVLPLDLEATESLAAKAGQALDRFGRIDMLIHNAGISQRARAVDSSFAVVKKVMTTNFLGPVALTGAVLPAMIRRGGGRIVVVSSLASKFGAPLRSAYNASKKALHGYYEALRVEAHEQNIKVTMVVPGFVRTEISRHALLADGSSNDRLSPHQAHGRDPRSCARKILRGVARGRREIRVAYGLKGCAISMLRLFFPRLLERILRSVKAD
jgi:dehydrogenase/reductase SDR family protein 7B